MKIEQFQVKYGRLPTEKDPDYLREIERHQIVSRFQVLDYPVMMPGKCTVNGCTGLDRKYVDFGLSLDYYGVVYICTICIKEVLTTLKDEENIATLLKEVATEAPPPVSVATTEEDIEKIKQVAADVHNKLKGVLEAYGITESSVNSDVDNFVPIVVGSIPIDIHSDKSDNKEEPLSSGSTEPKQRTTKSTSSSRRKNVPSFTGFRSTS